jgi:hypothetical protein
VSTPRFFGRSDASIAFGNSRPGHFFRQYLRYPFVGETGQVSFREGYNRGTDFFAYSTDGVEAFSRVLVPVYREQLELSGARRFGEVGRSLILGLSFTRDLVRYDGPPEITFGHGYDERMAVVGELPPLMQEQLRPRAASRLGLHVGTRHYKYVEYVGLDGMRDRQAVGLGFFAGVSVAKSIPFFTPGGAPRLDDLVTRGHASFTVPIGSSLLHGGTTIEARHEGSEWHDLLLESDLVVYARTEALPRQTLFLRAAMAGGWDTTLPFQLSLGGRESVRSLLEDQLPGGRSLLFVIEDRVVFGWPGPEVMDLGMTVFSDIGRVWPGDVPYGIDSGWQAAVGFGLRIGLPSGTRNILRADMVFPVGSVDASPVFRLTFELNKLRSGFFNPEVRRSRRFNLGPEIF